MIQLRSQITIKLLNYYFTNPRARNYINELARILGVDVGNLSRKLKELESEGIIISEFSGNQRYYFLNQKYPFLQELKKIYQAKYGLKEQLAKVLKKLPGLRHAYIFGSYAKGKFGQESDIDLLLIGRHSALQAKKAILPLQRELKREFNIVDFTESEFAKRKKNKDEFVREVFRNKITSIL